MEHAEQLELYTMAVLEAVQTAAQESLPSVGGGSGRVAGSWWSLWPVGWLDRICEAIL